MKTLIFILVFALTVNVALTATGNIIHYCGAKGSRSYTGNGDLTSSPSTTYPPWFAPRGMTYIYSDALMVVSEYVKYPIGTGAYSHHGCRIRSIPTSPSAIVTTYVGSATTDDCGDVPASDPSNGVSYASAKSNGTWGVYYNPSDTRVYFADSNNHKVKYIDLTIEAVYFLAGYGVLGDVFNVANPVARFNFPTQVFWWRNVLYTSDTDNNMVKKVPTSGSLIVTNFAALSYAGNFLIYRYRGYGLMTTKTGPDTTYVTYHAVFQVDVLSGVISQYIGSSITSGDITSGTDPTAWRLNNPCGLAMDCTRRELYITECGNHKVKKYNFAASTLMDYGGTGSSGTSGSPGPTAYSSYQFFTPYAVVLASISTTDYAWVIDAPYYSGSPSTSGGRISRIEIQPNQYKSCATDTMTHTSVTLAVSPDDPTLTMTQTFTDTLTDEESNSRSWTSDLTLTKTMTDEMSKSRSWTVELTLSKSLSDTHSITEEETQTATLSDEETLSASLTETHSITEEETEDKTLSMSLTLSFTHSHTHSNTDEESDEPTITMTLTDTHSLTNEGTDDVTLTATLTDSHSLTFSDTAEVTISGSDTKTVTDEESNTMSRSLWATYTHTHSISVDKPTEDPTQTFTVSTSDTLSGTPSETVFLGSVTSTFTETVTDPETRTKSKLTRTVTDEESKTKTISDSLTDSWTSDVTMEFSKSRSVSDFIPSPTPSLSLTFTDTNTFEFTRRTKTDSLPTKTYVGAFRPTRPPTAKPTPAPTLPPLRVTTTKGVVVFVQQTPSPTPSTTPKVRASVTPSPTPTPSSTSTQGGKGSPNSAGGNSNSSSSGGKGSSNGDNNSTNSQGPEDSPSPSPTPPVVLDTPEPSPTPSLFTLKPKATKKPTPAPPTTQPPPVLTTGPNGETDPPTPAPTPEPVSIYDTDPPTLPPGKDDPTEAPIKSQSEKQKEENSKQNVISRGVGALATASEEQVFDSVLIIAVAVFILCAALITYAAYKKRNPGLQRVKLDFKQKPKRKFDSIKYGTLLWMIFPRALVGEDEVEDDQCAEVELSPDGMGRPSTGATRSLLNYDDVFVDNVFRDTESEVHVDVEDSRPTTSSTGPLMTRITLDEGFHEAHVFLDQKGESRPQTAFESRPGTSTTDRPATENTSTGLSRPPTGQQGPLKSIPINDIESRPSTTNDAGENTSRPSSGQESHSNYSNAERPGTGQRQETQSRPSSSENGVITEARNNEQPSRPGTGQQRPANSRPQSAAMEPQQSRPGTAQRQPADAFDFSMSRPTSRPGTGEALGGGFDFNDEPRSNTRPGTGRGANDDTAVPVAFEAFAFDEPSADNNGAQGEDNFDNFAFDDFSAAEPPASTENPTEESGEVGGTWATTRRVSNAPTDNFGEFNFDDNVGDFDFNAGDGAGFGLDDGGGFDMGDGGNDFNFGGEDGGNDFNFGDDGGNDFNFGDDGGNFDMNMEDVDVGAANPEEGFGLEGDNFNFGDDFGAGGFEMGGTNSRPQSSGQQGNDDFGFSFE